MNTPSVLNELDLAALLCSKVCHDIINPVGAIVNGLEVLADDDDGDMREVAMDLIRKSAESTSSKLKFARLAFGAAGSAGSTLDLGELREVADSYISTDRVSFNWDSPMGQLPKNQAKLLLNLIVIAQSAIKRGGTVGVSVGPDLDAPEFAITTEGQGAAMPATVKGLFEGVADGEAMDARAVQPYYCGLLSRSVGASVVFTSPAEDMVAIAVSITRKD